MNSDQRQAAVYDQRVGVVVNRLLCREMDLSKLDETIFSLFFSLHPSSLGGEPTPASPTCLRNDGAAGWS